jgi:hypothetical protein
MDDLGHLMNAQIAGLDHTGANTVKQSIIFVLLHYTDDIRQAQGMNKIGVVTFSEFAVLGAIQEIQYLLSDFRFRTNTQKIPDWDRVITPVDCMSLKSAPC